MTHDEARNIFYDRSEARISIESRIEAQAIHLKSSGKYGEVAMQEATHRALANISEALFDLLSKH